jgi:GntR family transcriptional regulator/MocR family aminotransferase
MSKRISAIEIAIQDRPTNITLSRWLYQELRSAILDRRLLPGARLPATRDLARQYKLSRGTVVSVFEQLQAEGYLFGRAGAGTYVNERLKSDLLLDRQSEARTPRLPPPIHQIPISLPPRPFRSYEPALREFPTEVWARIAGQVMRRTSISLLAGGDPRGYQPLREAIAAYLGSSRGVNCSADCVVIVSGVQQGLDLSARMLLRPGDAVLMEDPGYFGAIAAFRNAGARVDPVQVDEFGLIVAKVKQRSSKVVYLTPAHQFPLGSTLSLDRRLEILAWAKRTGAFIIEDDYDSEYRFEGRPAPALQGLDKQGSVIFLGSFNKVLFPSLRIGYAVLPSSLLDRFLKLRVESDFFPPGAGQAILYRFITEGCFGRHLRRMRELYANRLGTLHEAARKYLEGALEISPVRAGLSTVGLLRNGTSSAAAERAATEHGIETMGLHRFAIGRERVQGVLLGFAAFEEREIRRGVINLAAALDRPSLM